MTDARTGDVQPGAALIVVRLVVVTLPPRSTAPAVAGCRLVGCSVVSGRSLRSRALAGMSQRVRVGLGTVLASRAPSPPATAAAAWRGRGRVLIAGWSLGGVGQPRIRVWYVPSLRYTRGLGWRMHCGVEVTESSTNKQHHLSWPPVPRPRLRPPRPPGGVGVGFSLRGGVWAE